MIRLLPVLLAAGVAISRPPHAPRPDAHAAPAQPSCAAARVVPEPARPRQGALFRVRVEGAPADAELRGTAAGEPLHFERGADGVPVAFAAAPLDSAATPDPAPLPVRIACGVAWQVDSLDAAVPVAVADYPVERLRVAPRFAEPPDSALAERLRREAAAAAEVGRGAHLTPRLWTAPFRRPRDGRVTSTFGRGREFNGAVTSRHLGTDYAGAVGAPVRAANRGVVRLADAFFLGGNVVYLDHGGGLVTAYLHLSARDVAVGDTVERGAVLGRVGATGRVTGPHLHWITRYGAVTVDPASVLRATADRSRP